MKNKLKFITKTFLIKTFAVLMIMGMMDSLAFSQTRIRFARGKSSATVTGTLNSGSGRSYVLGARAGQYMTVRVSSRDSISVDVGGNDLGEGDTIELRSTDDYIITVYNDDGYQANYSLYVAIR